MEQLIVSIKEVPNHPEAHIINLEGEFDGYAQENIADVQKLVDNAVQDSILIFDLEKLNYMNSYAIGHLIAWRNTLTNKKGQLFIVSMNSAVEESLSVVGSSILFRCFNNIDTAIEAL